MNVTCMFRVFFVVENWQKEKNNKTRTRRQEEQEKEQEETSVLEAVPLSGRLKEGFHFKLRPVPTIEKDMRP